MDTKKNKINIDSVWELFSQNDELDGVNPKIHIDFTTTPVYWVGMYKKLVLNHIKFNAKVIQFFKEANHELNVQDVKDAGEFVVYNRAWSYIQNIDPTNPDHLIAIFKYSDEYLDTSLKLGIHFFEQHEQYERCAVLKSILDEVELFSI